MSIIYYKVTPKHVFTQINDRQIWQNTTITEAGLRACFSYCEIFYKQNQNQIKDYLLRRCSKAVIPKCFSPICWII